jgi:hypothetical protein
VCEESVPASTLPSEDGGGGGESEGARGGISERQFWIYVSSLFMSLQ